MWTKIQSPGDINKVRLNARLLKYTGAGIPIDPPPNDPSYTTFVIQTNSSGSLSLKSQVHNPLFTPSLSQGNTGLLQKTASEMIEEGTWWF